MKRQEVVNGKRNDKGEDTRKTSRWSKNRRNRFPEEVLLNLKNERENKKEEGEEEENKRYGKCRRKEGRACHLCE